MAKITPDVYSVEQAAVSPQVVGNAKLQPNQYEGRLRIARFTYDTDTDRTQNHHVGLAVLPKGARVIGGFVAFGAMGAGATMGIGLAGNDDSGYIDADNSVSDVATHFLNALDVSAAGVTETLARTVALNYGYELEKECKLVMKMTGAQWAADKQVYGHVEYIVD